LTSKRYSLLLKGASAGSACIGRTAVGKPPTSIESWSGLVDTNRKTSTGLAGYF